MKISLTGDRAQICDLEYLSDYSPKDQRWDTAKRQACLVSEYYGELGVSKLSERIDRCANRLGAVLVSDDLGSTKLKIRQVYLCHVRFCPVCQKSRTAAWYRRLITGLPAVFAASPKAKYIFLTLTVRNIPVTELRETVSSMSSAFTKLLKRRAIARVLVGHIRTLEVSKSKSVRLTLIYTYSWQ